jgi:hypothetical protein
MSEEGVSPRYLTLAGILDDPVNLAILRREILRRGLLEPRWREKILPPPVMKGDRLVYPTMRGFQYNTATEEYHVEVCQPEIGSDWFVFMDSGEEIGPLDSLSNAKKVAEGLLQQRGYHILRSPPWTETEVSEYPLMKGHIT